jgi:mannose-1-phosphate guanylyltransferase/phosphomannomutase
MEVAGVSLLERNLVALLRTGITDVFVAVPTNPEIVEHVEQRCRAVVERDEAGLTVIVEDPPLGSIGAAALIPATVDALLVVNADNLTSLDLVDLLDQHDRHGAAVTLAVHDEPFHMPYGEITLDGDQVVDYVEKPTYTVTVSSALTVLDRRARALIDPGTHVMLPDLVRRALAAGLPIRGHRHSATWIDVNDMASLRRAEQLVADEPAGLGVGSRRA